LRFFSPPEKPTLSAPQHVLADAELARGVTHDLHEFGRGGFRLAARLALRVERGAQESHGGDARHFHRILEREEHALGGAFVGAHLQDALAIQQHIAFGDGVVRLAGQNIGERRFAGAVRAHDGRDLPLLDRQVQTVENLLVLDLDMQIFNFKKCHFFRPHKSSDQVSFIPARSPQRQRHSPSVRLRETRTNKAVTPAMTTAQPSQAPKSDRPASMFMTMIEPATIAPAPIVTAQPSQVTGVAP
jgi:hypothetical protein